MKDVIFACLRVTAIAFLSVACNPVNVHSDYLEGANIEQYNRICWVPTMDSSSGVLYDNPIFFQNLKTSIIKELNGKGYTMDCTNPDLLVMVRAKFKNEQDLLQIPVYSNYTTNIPDFYAGPGYSYNYNYYSNVPSITGYRVQAIEYTNTTIVIDIVEHKNNQLLWRGWATTEIDKLKSFRKDINKIVKEIFDEYPEKVK